MSKKIYTVLFLTVLSAQSVAYANAPVATGNTQNTITKLAPKPITLKNSRSFGEEWNLSLNNELLFFTGARFQKTFNKGHSRIGIGYHAFLPIIVSTGILNISYDEAIRSKSTKRGGIQTLFATGKISQCFDYTDGDSLVADTSPFPTLGIGYSWLKPNGLNTQVSIGGSAVNDLFSDSLFDVFVIPYIQASIGFGKIE